MYALCRLFLFVLLMTGLTACASNCDTVAPNKLPQFHAASEPDDAVVHKAIRAYLAASGGPPNSQFEYSREDLNGDGRRDVLVLFESPFYSWCTVDGCRMVVFEAASDHFKLQSEIVPVRGPVLVSDTRTDGWRDLVVRVSGRTGWPAKDVALKYDGARYPQQPEYVPGLPEEIAMANINGTEVFP